MAVTEVKEIWRGRDGEDQANPPMSNYSRVFRVITDDPFDTAAVVKLAAGVPRIGHVFPQDFNATCRRVRPIQESFSPKVWIVTCLYSTEQSFEPLENPLLEPAKTSWAGEEYQRNILVDLDGKPVVNSANEPFESGGIDVDDSRLVSVTRKNVAAVPSWILLAVNATNSNAFVIDGFGVAAGVAKCKPFRLSEPQERNQIQFRVLEIVIAYRKEGWLTRLLDAGYNELIDDPAGGNNKILSAITNPDGTPISKPALLDGNGEALARDPADASSFASAVYLDFRGNPTFDFANLPLS